MPLGKLIRTERTIIVYKKTKQTTYGKEIQQINVDQIPLNVLKSIVTANDDDPLLYDGYILSPEELNKFNAILENKIELNHDKFDYALEWYGIYDSNDSKPEISS